MEFKIILKNLIIIGVILGGTFASQQPWFKTNSQVWVNQNPQESQPIKKATNWFNDQVSSKISNSIKGLGASVSGGVAQNKDNIASVTESVEKGIETQKNILVENSTNTTKKFIAQKILDALGVKAEDLAQCPAN